MIFEADGHGTPPGRYSRRGRGRLQPAHGPDEAATLAALKAHRKDLVDAKIAEHQGRIVKLTGDGMLAEFPSVVNAVACAADIQREMRQRNAEVPQDRRIEFRIGVNLGDIIVEDDDIFGDGVNVAARLEGWPQPGRRRCLRHRCTTMSATGSTSPSRIGASRR